MRPAPDSNVLLYGFLEPDSGKGVMARDLVRRAARSGGVLAVQALGEFLWVVRRKRPEWAERAVQRAESFRKVFGLVETDFPLLLAAQDLAARHRVPFWDAVIFKAAARGGATLFQSEDLQDGARLDGLRVVNPFNAANGAELDCLLPG
jgi:predicted nucleic acid-binding protein